MRDNKRYFSVKAKTYIFIIVTVLSVAFATVFISFSLSVEQLDSYYKQFASYNARNAAFYVDGDYVERLSSVVGTEEYQWLRRKAEDENNEQLIEDYLKEQGLWDEYYQISSFLTTYQNNMDGISYIYLLYHGNQDTQYCMHLIDDQNQPLYRVGFYEIRVRDLMGKDLENLDEAVVYNGPRGWLCTDYEPVYDSNGNCVCIVGCDLGMEEVIAERSMNLAKLMLGSIAFTAVVLVIAVWHMSFMFIAPLTAMTNAMKKFNPSEHKDYDSAGVINLKICTHDEISDIYNGIRKMQMDIIDYLKDKDVAENAIRNKRQRIDKLNDETNKDPLTGLRSKSAFVRKSNELNHQKKAQFSIVMVDMNNLKKINDVYGHKAGDQYIIGCCDMIKNVFKKSMLYRIGGDEFVVILNGENYENRMALVEKLKSDFDDCYRREDKDPWLRFSAAIGMADKEAGDRDFETVFQRADKNMYEDKAAFKKKYCCYR